MRTSELKARKIQSNSNTLINKTDFALDSLKKIITYAGFIVIPLKISFSFVKKKFCLRVAVWRIALARLF
jgi:hypothetical protein